MRVLTHVRSSELESRDVFLENCIAVMADSANVMCGEKGGLTSLFKNTESHVFFIGGCCLHDVHKCHLF